MTRQEAIQALNEIFDDSEFSRYEAWYGGAMDMAIEALTHECESCIWDICNYNRVEWDAEPKHGEWIEGETFYFCGEQQFPMTCSVCGRTALNEPWHYCPNCGAKMDGGVSDGDID